MEATFQNYDTWKQTDLVSEREDLAVMTARDSMPSVGYCPYCYRRLESLVEEGQTFVYCPNNSLSCLYTPEQSEGENRERAMSWRSKKLLANSTCAGWLR